MTDAALGDPSLCTSSRFVVPFGFHFGFHFDGVLSDRDLESRLARREPVDQSQRDDGPKGRESPIHRRRIDRVSYGERGPES